MADFPNHETSVALLEGLANESRSLSGVAPLECGGLLQELAQCRASDMAQRGYFSHDTPEGTDFLDALREAQVAFRWAGENLGKTGGLAQRDLRALHQHWLGSPQHQANLLDPRFTHVGIGLVVGDDGLGIACCIFVQE